MKNSIPKICSDSLRNFSQEKHGVKLKSAHAHELVAAYFGYPSKNAMLADSKFPIDNLSMAEVVVMTPDPFIDRRRESLDGLPEELPDSYSLGEAVYEPLFASGDFACQTPPFRSHPALAKYLLDRNEAFRSLFRLSPAGMLRHVVEVRDYGEELLLTVFHVHESPKPGTMVDGRTFISLKRVAGRIGFGRPKVSPPESWSAGAKKSLRSLGVL